EHDAQQLAAPKFDQYASAALGRCTQRIGNRVAEGLPQRHRHGNASEHDGPGACQRDRSTITTTITSRAAAANNALGGRRWKGSGSSSRTKASVAPAPTTLAGASSVVTGGGVCDMTGSGGALTGRAAC